MNTLIADRIRYLRRSILVTSYLYYIQDENIISDDEWQKRADELTRLQNENPNLKLDCYDDMFSDWNGSTGYHLKYDDWVISKATQLLRYEKSQRSVCV